ncbi:hypothetical protein [Halococcus saccharolyticus]|uniref:Uncharacterized protein n=1 Tax=Halococcus saccharolyticus DSM 5350 TaxID=1227455 RepID=M0MCX0_9EURY|nr:hypothetical protein [Halococcus saccharolyticus]EMA43576.1 hypothetical protein C449_13492 [Halococcus saccharolyticus DSM 5350]
MGAASFFTKAFGSDADEAFRRAVEEAEYRHGKAGYTGTIAEKPGYTVIPNSEHKNRDKEKYANSLMAEQDDRIDDKWGNAGAINLSGTQAAQRYRKRNGLKGNHGSVWLFFGMASC